MLSLIEYWTIIIASSIGLVVGLLTGMFGVGGGFLLTPLLMILLGMHSPTAVGTGLSTILVSSSLGLVQRRKTDTVDIKLAFVIASGSILGVWLGSCIMRALIQLPKVQLFTNEVDVLQFVLLCLFVILLGSIVIYLFWDFYHSEGQAPLIRIGKLAAVKVPPCVCFRSLEQPKLSVFPLIVLGIIVGIMTALLGTGGGVILLPALVYLVGQRAAKAAGTSLLLVWISSIAAVIVKFSAGEINYPILAFLVFGGIVGISIGTNLGLKFSGPQLRLYFAYVVIGALLIVLAKLCLIFNGFRI